MRIFFILHRSFSQYCSIPFNKSLKTGEPKWRWFWKKSFPVFGLKHKNMSFKTLCSTHNSLCSPLSRVKIGQEMKNTSNVHRFWFCTELATENDVACLPCKRNRTSIILLRVKYKTIFLSQKLCKKRSILVKYFWKPFIKYNLHMYQQGASSWIRIRKLDITSKCANQTKIS